MAQGHVGQLPGGVDAPRVGAAGHARDGEGQQAGREVRLDPALDRGAAQPEAIVGPDDGKGAGGEAEGVERLGDREVGLVGGVDAPALEGGAARRPRCRPRRRRPWPGIEGGGRRQAGAATSSRRVRWTSGRRRRP